MSGAIRRILGKPKEYALKKFWDKPNRNKNKMNLSQSQREKLSTLFGRAKKDYLKELRK